MRIRGRRTRDGLRRDNVLQKDLMGPRKSNLNFGQGERSSLLAV